MRSPAWYVIQVMTGRERQACQTIERECRLAESLHPERPALLQECFAPTFATQVKLRGAWVDEERLLLPGYVVAVTDDPWRLARFLRRVPEFTRLLRMGRTIAPLSEDDRSWIERWTTQGNRTVPMSFAYKEGDKIVVTEGPLVGHEAMILRVNRRKSLAHLEIHAGRLTIHTTVGLGILPALGDGTEAAPGAEGPGAEPRA